MHRYLAAAAPHLPQKKTAVMQPIVGHSLRALAGEGVKKKKKEGSWGSAPRQSPINPA